MKAPGSYLWVVCHNDFPDCVVLSEEAAKAIVAQREKESVAAGRLSHWHYRAVPLLRPLGEPT